MEYRELGDTGILVSRVCFGSLTLGPLCANLSLAEGRDLLLEAFKLGVTFIDSAEQYRTYPYIRAALDQSEVPIVVASKTYAHNDQEASWAIEDARIALGRETLDIFLLHEVRDEKDWHSRSAVWQVLLDAKANGIIKAIGLSTHSAKVAAMAANIPEVDIIHPLLNLAGIGINDGGTDAMLSAIAAAKAAGKGVYSMKAIAGGGLMHQAKEAICWAYQQPEVDAVAIGFRDRAELITDIGWLNGEEPAEAQEVALIDRNMTFDKEPSCHGCGLCIKRCSTGALYLGDDNLVAWDKSKCLYCGYCIAACPWFCISFC